MTNERYKQIREGSNTLYVYFVENGGTNVGVMQFNQLLAAWVMMMGIEPHMGQAKIFQFLDKKFGYVKNKA